MHTKGGNWQSRAEPDGLCVDPKIDNGRMTISLPLSAELGSTLIGPYASPENDSTLEICRCLKL